MMEASSPRSEAFPKALRVRRRGDFRRVQDRGRKLHTGHFILFTLPSEDGGQRLGITVTRKVGNAVTRNRLKRCVREVFRRHRERFPQDQALVVLVKRGGAELRSGGIEEELLRAGQRLGLGARPCDVSSSA
jgi:ribonuclease P protein component